MMSSTTVRIDDLRAGLVAILDEVQWKFGGEIDLRADYYWDIWVEDAFDMGSAPTPDVGQLSDDLDSLRETLRKRAERELTIWHDLAHMIGILKRIAALDARPTSD